MMDMINIEPIYYYFRDTIKSFDNFLNKAVLKSKFRASLNTKL